MVGPCLEWTDFIEGSDQGPPHCSVNTESCTVWAYDSTWYMARIFVVHLVLICTDVKLQGPDTELALRRLHRGRPQKTAAVFFWCLSGLKDKPKVLKDVCT